MRSTGRAGSCLLSCERQRGAPVTFNVRPHSTMAKIDIRSEMADAVRRMGGSVIDDQLRDANFVNADYWFPDYEVVGELKCLSEDLSSSRSFNDRVSCLYASWIERGLVPPRYGRVSLSLRGIPLECAREFLHLIKRRFEVNVLKKANAQIKGIKKHLCRPDAKGLLLLANDGNYLLPPGVMAHLLARATRGQHRSINSVIYFSVNVLAVVPGISDPALFWVDGCLPDREPVPMALRGAIRSSWISQHSALVETPIYEVASCDPSQFENIQFRKDVAGA